jgi:hypothetical protein
LSRYNFHNWPKPEFKNKTIADDGMNSDIISGINGAFFPSVAMTRSMAQTFKGSSRMASAYNVWSFVKNNIKYRKDPEGLQLIKLPNRLIHERELGGDCKSFTLLCGSILKNLGYPVVLRYTSYSYDPTPSHVYCLTYEKDGSPIIVDAVYNKFNQEVPFKHKRDYLMKLK